MGRRRREARFSPGVYVFPGGVVEAPDRQAVAATELTEACAAAFRSPAEARTLAMTAVRETAEETGLVLGIPGDVGAAEGGWRRFRRLGVAPPLDRLIYVGRAITPTASPNRYHARFFMVDGKHLEGELRGDGELLDLRWVRAASAARANLMDVTEAMLAEVEARLAGDDRDPLFLCYRQGRSVFRRETSGPRR